MVNQTVPVSFEKWQGEVPDAIRASPVWKSIAYQKALYLYDLVWEDCEMLTKDVRGRATADQLIHSAGSISANMEEGYGRGLGRDYARILRIALGEARETQGWYFRGRRLMPAEVVRHRMALANEVIALLVTMIDQLRGEK